MVVGIKSKVCKWVGDQKSIEDGALELLYVEQ